MTTATRPLSRQLAPALLAISMLLAAWNWYVQPQRGLGLDGHPRHARAPDGGGSRRSTNAARGFGTPRGRLHRERHRVRRAHVGVFAGPEAGHRARCDEPFRSVAADVDGHSRSVLRVHRERPAQDLSPLAANCDGARVQAFQRLAGWTWVLTGLTFATAWLVLPVKRGPARVPRAASRRHADHRRADGPLAPDAAGTRRDVCGWRARATSRSHVEPHRPHQGERVALLDDAGPASGSQSGSGRPRPRLRSARSRRARPARRPPAQAQVVRGHEARGAAFDQARTMASAPMRRSCELVPWRSSSIKKSTGGALPVWRMMRPSRVISA